MNPYDRQPQFGGIFQRNAWLLPLLLGVGIGAFIFGMLGDGWGGRGHMRGGYGDARHAPQFRNESAQQQAAPVVPQQVDPREGRMGHEFGGERFSGRHDHAFGFMPFGLSRLLIPALLIGAGLWFLRGNRGGNGFGGPGQSAQPGPGYSPYTPPAAAQEPAAPGTTDPPSTNETRRL